MKLGGAQGLPTGFVDGQALQCPHFVFMQLSHAIDLIEQAFMFLVGLNRKPIKPEQGGVGAPALLQNVPQLYGDT